ncbi:MAG: helix-turn-helix domain-containing protein [Bacteroidetes bacterium]|nr:helix-turn-helix domain-containing protein [Bacteroidota bacterium]
MNFGEFIKEKRLQKRLSLRNFCELCVLDPSNWSKIERSRLPLTLDRGKLEEIASILDLKAGSEDWQKFFDLVTIAKGIIPEYVYSDEEVLEALPIFFRTASGEKPNKQELEKIITLIKQR